MSILVLAVVIVGALVLAFKAKPKVIPKELSPEAAWPWEMREEPFVPADIAPKEIPSDITYQQFADYLMMERGRTMITESEKKSLLAGDNPIKLHDGFVYRATIIQWMEKLREDPAKMRWMIWS